MCNVKSVTCGDKALSDLASKLIFLAPLVFWFRRGEYWTLRLYLYDYMWYMELNECLLNS